MLASDYLQTFLEHPTWSGAFVIVVLAIVIGWIIVAFINLLR